MTAERTSSNHGAGALTAAAINPVVGAAIIGYAAGLGTLGGTQRPKCTAAAALGGTGQLTPHTPAVPQQLTMFSVTGNFNAVADPSISGVLNQPQIQPVSALVTFTPRLPRGTQLYVSNYLVSAAYNAEQTVNLIGTPTGGVWTLRYGAQTTAQLPWNATPLQVQTALQQLPSIGGGNVTVVADVEPQAYDIQFTNALGLQPVAILVGDPDLLTNAEGSGFCEITVTPTALGSQQVIADTAISMPPLTARIWNGVLSTIDFVDTPGFELVANTDNLNIGDGSDGNGNLIYDVTFSSVTFNGATQYLAPFAFQAPTGGATICLTDPNLNRLDYAAPSDLTWTPSTADSMPLMLGRNWRQRALQRSA